MIHGMGITITYRFRGGRYRAVFDCITFQRLLKWMKLTLRALGLTHWGHGSQNFVWHIPLRYIMNNNLWFISQQRYLNQQLIKPYIVQRNKVSNFDFHDYSCSNWILLFEKSYMQPTHDMFWTLMSKIQTKCSNKNFIFESSHK